MSSLNKIIGKEILDIKIGQGTFYPLHSEQLKQTPQIVDELWIDIGDYKLVISNPYSLNSPFQIDSLINTKIKSVSESDIEAVLITESGQVLTIDLRDESYIGPEAMVLHGPENFCAVWN